MEHKIYHLKYLKHSFQWCSKHFPPILLSLSVNVNATYFKRMETHTAFDGCVHVWQENLSHITQPRWVLTLPTVVAIDPQDFSPIFPTRQLRWRHAGTPENSVPQGFSQLPIPSGDGSCFWWWGSFPCSSRLILLPVQSPALAPLVPQVCHTELTLLNLTAYFLTSLLLLPLKRS